MCGVCGMAGATRGWTVPAPRLEAMTAALLHRGPDEGGTWTGPGVGIGARRLSVIDVAHGHQPMSNEDGSCVVAFNGEIYNADDLRADLEALGYTFRTRCDTEVVLRAYEAWDEHAVQRFNGMFAIAVWDGRREQLYLARDRVGIKPLMYTERAGVFAFSSELDSLAHSGLVEGRINVAALDACLAYLFVPHPETIYEGVYKLGRGAYLVAGSVASRDVLAARVSARDHLEARNGCGGVLRAFAGLGALAADQRCAAGGVPQRRDRFERCHGDAGGGERPAGEDLHDRIRGCGGRRDGLRAYGGETFRYRPHRTRAASGYRVDGVRVDPVFR